MNVAAAALLIALTGSSAFVALAQERGGTARGAAPQGGRGGGRGPAPEDDLSAVYFAAADWDGDGVVQYSEAEVSLSVDREGFALYDADNDGLISPTEFAQRYRRIVEKGGVFSPPRARPDAPRVEKKDGRLLLETWDDDGDERLAAAEVARALEEARITDPPAETVLETLDTDRNGTIDGPELDGLADLLAPSGAKRAASRLTLAELFDRPVPRDDREGATIGPVRTIGPVSSFTRLDYDRDGVVRLNDLEELQRPWSGSVRPAVVLATLDRDGDGALSPEEFAAAMR